MVIIGEPVAWRRQANLNQLFIVSDDGNTSAHTVFLCAVVIGGAVVAIVDVYKRQTYGSPFRNTRKLKIWTEMEQNLLKWVERTGIIGYNKLA